MEGGTTRCKRGGRGAVEEADHRHRFLLRAACQRPRDRRTGENGKSLASLHLGHTPTDQLGWREGYHIASLLVGSLDRCHRRRQFALAFTGAGMAARR
jgi:hypothetical protein